MIKQIKNIIIENKDKFGMGEFSSDQIKVSKFFHGNPSVNTKVLFFISIEKIPLCLIKMVRNADSNDLILRETEGIEYFKSIGLRVPKLFFTGEINDLKYLCQGIVSGQPVGKRSEAEAFRFIAQYNNSVIKAKKIKISSILDMVKNLEINGDKEYNQTIKLLSERKEIDLYFAAQHGDLTYRNLMKDGEVIVFIDFENFGLRSVWGIDVIHYLTRMVDANNEKRDVVDTMIYFVKATKQYRDEYDLEISDKECEVLFLIDLLFEILQKNLFYRRSEIVPLMKDLWLK